jgi:anaerobic selenocysteine-containing dehydrogenase
VVIDVFMTETARLADYVLPAPTQYEKWEATFFNFEFPRNVFHLRRPVLAAPEGPLPEPEIHARLVETAGLLDDSVYAPLRAAAAQGRAEFATAFFGLLGERPELGGLSTAILYRTLGETLPDGASAAAVLWGACHTCVRNSPEGVRKAGYGEGLEAGERLFDAVLTSGSGVVITDDGYDATMTRVRTNDGRVNLIIPELIDELRCLDPATIPGNDPEWPFVLSAGERRSFTANTIIRDPAWRKKDSDGALRMHPHDAELLGVTTGDHLRLVTGRASVIVTIETTDAMRPGHISLPNGYGLDHPDDGTRIVTGVAPNELTSTADRDAIAGTPWHKSVAARLEKP